MLDYWPDNILDMEKILGLIRKKCKDNESQTCYGCPYASDRMNDYQCRIQRITGTYPDTWKEVKS